MKYIFTLIFLILFTSCNCKNHKHLENDVIKGALFAKGVRYNYNSILHKENCSIITTSDVCIMCGKALSYDTIKFCGSYEVREY